MQTLIVQIEDKKRAQELQSVLAAMNFVKEVTAVSDTKELLTALQEHQTTKAAIVHRKNKAIAKYL